MVNICFVNVCSTKISKKVSHLFYISVRCRTSRFLGYYPYRTIPVPVYEQRKQEYRDKVLMPLELMPSLKDRLKEINAKDPVLHARVDIGFPSFYDKNRITVKDRLELKKKIRENKEIEKLARNRELKIDLNEVRYFWQKDTGRFQLCKIAEHYGVFESLFEHGYFVPSVPLNIFYDFGEDSVSPVCNGNILEAVDASKIPHVDFISGPDDYWTLVLTNLDGHLLDTNSEYLHWFVGNIQGADLKTGETICDYLQPFAYKGTGYHRLVYVLYKQDKKLDFSKLKRQSPCLSLKERTFKTFNFYKEYQDFITPAGIAFFQCTWDPSLTNFFHNVLNMREPIFEYKQPDIYFPPQLRYPHLQFFNIYLDRYRDPKEIKKEVLLKRLKMVHPFKEEKPMSKYPNLHRVKLPEKYSWLADDIKRERLRIGKYRDLRPHSVYPQEDNQGDYFGHKN